MNAQFWMVWCPTRNSPTFKHESEQAAIKEAERLAIGSPGEPFFVLEATALRVVDNMARIDLRRDEIPF